MFNNNNFWINMQKDVQIKDLNFNEMDSSQNWEYVMLDVSNFVQPATADDDNQGDLEELNIKKDGKDVDKDQLNDIAQVLDIPPPWAPKIRFDKEAFFRGTPIGENSVFYKKVRVDNYAPYMQEDGLVQKLIIY